MVKYDDDKMCMALCCFSAVLILVAFTLESWSVRCDGEVDCDPAVSTKDMKMASSVLFSFAAFIVFMAFMAYVGMDMGLVSMIPGFGGRKFGSF
jgi:hypothetical protein